MIRRRLFSSPSGPELLGLFLLVGLPAIAACGKKGPPLPPLQLTPGRVEELAIARREESVRVRLKVPSSTSDGKQTRDIAAIEVYGLSGKAEDPFGRSLGTDDLLKYATLVGRTAVKPPPLEPTPEDEEKAEKAEQKGLPPKPQPPFDPRPGQGDYIIMNEVITPELMKPWVHPKQKNTEEKKKDVPPGTPLWWPAQEDEFSRMYVAIALNKHGRHGPLSNRVAMPLMDPPGPPGTPITSHTAEAIGVMWTEPTTGLKRATQAPATPDVLPSKPVVQGASPTTYNVYEAKRIAPGTMPAAAAAPSSANGTAASGSGPGGTAAAFAPPPKPEIVAGPGGDFVLSTTPLNTNPLPTAAFGDVRLAFGQERCYAIRATEKFGSASVESTPSGVACITPTDKFAPAAPKNLSAVGGENGVSLIWEPNTEADLAGYIVQRGEVPADGSAPKLTPLTPQPIAETTYRDGTARPGVRYVYAVVAVDRAAPANVSEASNLVEATVR